MKIRTDFVTNSSSTSEAEIVIDNIVLLEILQRYKEQGVFGEAKADFAIGTYSPIYWSDFDKEIKTPAFHYVEDMYGEGWSLLWDDPGTLDEVLHGIIEIIDNDNRNQIQYDQILYEKMKEELYQKEEEIQAGYLKVFWKHKDETEKSVGDEFKWLFIYEQKTGEQYHVEYYQGEDDDDV